MAISLLEQARLAAANGEDKRAGVIMAFPEQSMVLTAMSTTTIRGNAKAWTRESSLGEADPRAVNEGYTPSNGETETLVEPLKIYGGELDVDNFIVQTGGADARTAHELMKAKALARRVGYDLIKGSTTASGGATASPKSLNGLQVRYGGGFGSTAVSTAGANGAQILANNGASQALSMSKLDELLMLVDNPTHLVMPRMLTVRMKAFLRSSASMSYTEDEFGRRIDTYNGVPILWADENGGLAAIAFDENNNSTASIYALSVGPDALSIIQSADIQVTDLGYLESKPAWRTRVEWYIGLADIRPRSVARLYNVANITAVA